jgi:carnitine 3-dehydrogenase
VRFGVVGTGVIGAGWATRALARGWDVVAHDPAPGAEVRLRSSIQQAWPSVTRLGLYPGANPSRIEFVASINAVASSCAFVQESVPENLDTKRAVLAAIDRAAPEGTIVASSTSGLLPTDLAADLANPARFVVGHPFNPVYLLPLVEVVGGRATSAATIESAVALYTDLDMHPLHVRTEVPGFLSNRLQEAVWREILHLVADGVATTGELDEAILYGPGLRWAGMGTNLTFHLAGGQAGMRGMLEQFGPALEWPWTHLVAPPLTDELTDRMVDGTRDQAAGRSVAALERLRDDYLLAVMAALGGVGVGAGNTLTRRHQRVVGATPGWQPSDGPLRYEVSVPPEWVDYNGHLTEWAYSRIFADATDHALLLVGFDEQYRTTEEGTFYAVENHVRFLREVPASTRVIAQVSVVGTSTKAVHFSTVLNTADGTPAATFESVLLHVDVSTTKVRDMPSWLVDRFTSLTTAPPDWVGQSVEFRGG